MDGTVILLLSLYVGITVGEITIKSQRFVVEENTGVITNILPLALSTKASLASCAAQCSKHTDCCSASYSPGDMSCRLYSCCFPTTVTSSGTKHLRKRPNLDVIHFPTDCSELAPGSDNGVYTIYPTDTLQVNVYCDMRLECGTGWTVVQRRSDGTVNFNVDWAAYKAGFGDVANEFWIGNNILNIMTSLKRYILRFDMEDFNGDHVFAEYHLFTVADESLQFMLTIGGYSGTAGDSMVGIYSLDGKRFTTLDRDNDDSSPNCAKDSRKGAWWFRDCARVNPNGLYKSSGSSGTDTIYWREYRDLIALKSISIKIKPS